MVMIVVLVAGGGFGWTQVTGLGAARIHDNLLQHRTCVHEPVFEDMDARPADEVSGNADADIVGDHFVPGARGFIAGTEVDELRSFVVERYGVADGLAVEGENRGEVSANLDGSGIEKIELIFQVWIGAAWCLGRGSYGRCLDTREGAAQVGYHLPFDVPGPDSAGVMLRFHGDIAVCFDESFELARLGVSGIVDLYRDRHRRPVGPGNEQRGLFPAGGCPGPV